MRPEGSKEEARGQGALVEEVCGGVFREQQHGGQVAGGGPE